VTIIFFHLFIFSAALEPNKAKTETSHEYDLGEKKHTSKTC
jgi:hypothetical protein